MTPQKKKEVYRLHIDHVPHSSEVTKSQIRKDDDLFLDAKGNAPIKESFGVWAFIWDKVQFVLVSAVVFFSIYAFINWPAISINIEHYWQVWRGVESPLQKLVDDPVKDTEVVADVSLTTRGSSPLTVPPLDMEVTPTDMRVIIPRINQNVPVVGVRNDNLIARKWNDLESDIQKALQSGVIHYPGTALPGEQGNVVVSGHSSYYAWDPGRFKDVFALLHDVRNEDKIVVYFNQQKYTYEVYDIRVVLPKDVDVLAQTDTEELTLITCTPIGTNLKRLIIHAKLVRIG